jgi:hypothetical protein
LCIGGSIEVNGLTLALAFTRPITYDQKRKTS